MRDFLIEKLEIGLLSLDANENLLGHPFEGLILLLFTILVDFNMNFSSGIFSLVNESSKVLSKGLLPQELKILVLVNKVSCCIFDLGKVVSHDLKGTEEFELVLYFNQVVTVASVEARHLNSQ